MEGAKLTQIEKKMEMSLDDIIKQNRSKPAGSGKPGTAARAPLQIGKGTKAQARVGAAKPGVAGKRQTIQQKKGVVKASPGMRLNKPVAGGVGKGLGGIKRVSGAGHNQTLAQKIVGRARSNKQQQAPKQMGKLASKSVARAQQAPKQLGLARQGKQVQAKQQQAPKQLNQAAPKQTRNQIRFSGVNKALQAPKQLHSAPKSLAQTMNQRRRGGGSNKNMAQGQRNVSAARQQAAARAPLHTGPNRRNRGPATQHADLRPVNAGVRKRGPHNQARAPIYQARAPIYQAPAQVYQQRSSAPYQQQQQRRQAPMMMMQRRGPPPREQYAPVAPFRQQVQMRQAPNPILLARQQAVMQALRLQQLEDERNRAERNAFIHKSMEMMNVPARSAQRQMAPQQVARVPVSQAGMGRMGSVGHGRGDGYGLSNRGFQQQPQQRYSGYA